MAQYIPKDAVVAEIEKRKNMFFDMSKGCEDASSAKAGFYAQAQTLEGILSFLDTLEVKEVDSGITLEDISALRQIMFDYNRQVRNEMSIPNDEEYCKEVLSRFKAQKGEKV